MLKSLIIQNYALIVNETINFTDGLNILMGETGAGKSMIISSLEMLFGARSDTSFVRYGEKKAVLEGEFYLKSNNFARKLLAENSYDLPENEILIIRREISSTGGSRAFINDSPAGVNLLKNLANFLIDFHGQHEHQSLLDKSTHITFLDNYTSDKTIFNQYRNDFTELATAIDEYKKLLRREKDLKQKLEYDRFRLDEITKVNPQENEDEQLNNKLKILQNSEFITQTSGSVDLELYSADDSIYGKLAEIKHKLSSLEAYNPEFKEYITELETSLISLREISIFAKDYAASIAFDPVQIEEIRQRLVVLRNLTKKYGSLEEILVLKEQLEKEIDTSENFELKKYNLVEKIKSLKVTLGKSAHLLHKQRKSASRELSEKIVEKLSFLGIPNAQFASKYNVTETNSDIDNLSVEIEGKTYLANENGIDDIEFYISTNLGQNLQPLVQVASGGEISRIMLSIKSIFAKLSNVPILIFDEIDTGISGRIAQQTGIAMKELSKTHQIIAVTHLPQIAAIGTTNILVEKTEAQDSTYSKAKILNQSEKIEEVAKLISGGKITTAALDQSAELINAVSKF